ncbi:MAG: hypothetical protein DSY90_08045 [Deltaproteobacteria bacterium]|nr:MAG: hypothetical protein DSY90_08045 [Deltaproteobacteria bacterium]
MKLPAGVEKIRVRAHDLVSGFGGKKIILDLSKTRGAHYTVRHYGKQKPRSGHASPCLSVPLLWACYTFFQISPQKQSVV